MTPRPIFGLLCVLANGLLAGGCNDDVSPCSEPVPLPCDIRSEACRCTVFDATKQLRNQPEAKAPPTRVISREQFATETRSAMASAMQSDVAIAYQEALKLLSLLPASSSLDEAEAEATISGVAAYYDTRDKSITIIADAAEEQEEGVFTLSHEYVHALQDQREGFENLESSDMSTDGYLAVKTLTEGEAVLLSDLVLFDLAGRPFDEGSLAFFDRLLTLTLESIGTSTAPLTESQLALPYPVGAGTLARAYLGGGIASVARFFQQRPSTFTGWFDPAGAAGLPTLPRCGPPEPPAGYKVWGADRLGGSAMPALGALLAYSDTQMLELAKGWNTDLFTLYSAASDPREAAVAWRITFGNEALAAELESRFKQTATKLEVSRIGAELSLIGASNPAVLAGWAARTLCTLIVDKSRSDQATRLVPELTSHVYAPHGVLRRLRHRDR